MSRWGGVPVLWGTMYGEQGLEGSCLVRSNAWWEIATLDLPLDWQTWLKTLPSRNIRWRALINRYGKIETNKYFVSDVYLNDGLGIKSTEWNSFLFSMFLVTYFYFFLFLFSYFQTQLLSSSLFWQILMSTDSSAKYSVTKKGLRFFMSSWNKEIYFVYCNNIYKTFGSVGNNSSPIFPFEIWSFINSILWKASLKCGSVSPFTFFMYWAIFGWFFSMSYCPAIGWKNSLTAVIKGKDEIRRYWWMK